MALFSIAPIQCSRLKAARRRALELELRQMELRRTNPAWGQMHESIVDHAAIAERKEERAEAERERAREYRSVACCYVGTSYSRARSSS